MAATGDALDIQHEFSPFVRPSGLPMPVTIKNTKRKTLRQGLLKETTITTVSNISDVTLLPGFLSPEHKPGKRFSADQRREIEWLLADLRKAHQALQNAPSDVAFKASQIQDAERKIQEVAVGGELAEKAHVNVEILRPAAWTLIKVAEAKVVHLDSLREKNEGKKKPGLRDSEAIRDIRTSVWKALERAKEQLEALEIAIRSLTGVVGGYEPVHAHHNCDCCGHPFEPRASVCTRCGAKRAVVTRGDPELHALWESFRAVGFRALAGVQSDLQRKEATISDLKLEVQSCTDSHESVRNALDQAQQALLQAKQDIFVERRKEGWKSSAVSKTTRYEVKLDRARDVRNRPFGLEFHDDVGLKGLRIKAISQDSLAEVWNKGFPKQKILPDDVVVAIGEVDSDPEMLRMEYNKGWSLDLVIKHVDCSPNWVAPGCSAYFGKAWCNAHRVKEPLSLALRHMDNLEREIRGHADSAVLNKRARPAITDSSGAIVAVNNDFGELVALNEQVYKMQVACQEDASKLQEIHSSIKRQRQNMGFEEMIMMPVLDDVMSEARSEFDGLVQKVDEVKEQLRQCEKFKPEALTTYKGDQVVGLMTFVADGGTCIAAFSFNKDAEACDVFGVRATHTLWYLEGIGPLAVYMNETDHWFSDEDGSKFPYTELPMLQFSIDGKLLLAVIMEVGRRRRKDGMTHKLLYIGRNAGPTWVKIIDDERMVKDPSGLQVPFTRKVRLQQFTYRPAEAEGKFFVDGPDIRLGPDFDGAGNSDEKLTLQAELVRLEQLLADAQNQLHKAQYQQRRAEIRVKEVKKAVLQDQVSTSEAEDAAVALEQNLTTLRQTCANEEKILRKSGIVIESSVVASAIQEMSRTMDKLKPIVRQKQTELDNQHTQILNNAHFVGLDFSEDLSGDMERRTAMLEDAVGRDMHLHPYDNDVKNLHRLLVAFRQLQGEIDELTKVLEINRMRLVIACLVQHFDAAMKSVSITQTGAKFLEPIASKGGQAITVKVHMQEGFSKGQTVLISPNSDAQETNVVANFGSEHVEFVYGLKNKHKTGAAIVIQAAVLQQQAQLGTLRQQISSLIGGGNGASDVVRNLKSFGSELQDLQSLLDQLKEMLVDSERPQTDLRIVMDSFYKTRLKASGNADNSNDYSPRKAAPELKYSLQTLELANRPAAEAAAKALEIEPWQDGGTGTLSKRKYNRKYALHFDMHFRAKNVRISPDQTSASWVREGFGGFIFSVEPLKRRTCGRYFEVLVEDVDFRYGRDGIGIGLAARPHPSDQRSRPDKDGNYEGFATELLNEAWLVGYDGRAHLQGRSCHLKGRELPNGMWPWRKGQYADAAGSYQKNDNVQYYSNADQDWDVATVIDVDARGCIRLTVRDQVLADWISVEAQGRTVRPIRGVYAQHAGFYQIDDWVDLYINPEKDWMPFAVVEVDDHGSIALDCDRETFLPVETQAHAVRPCRTFRKGGKIGLLNTQEGHLYYFWNDEVKYVVLNANIPWEKELNAVIDLDGCIQTIHLLDNNGNIPTSATSSFFITPKPGTKMFDEIAPPSKQSQLEVNRGALVPFHGSQAPATSNFSSHTQASWTCDFCTFINTGSEAVCGICGKPQRKQSQKALSLGMQPIPESSSATSLRNTSKGKFLSSTSQFARSSSASYLQSKGNQIMRGPH